MVSANSRPSKWTRKTQMLYYSHKAIIFKGLRCYVLGTIPFFCERLGLFLPDSLLGTLPISRSNSVADIKKIS